MTPQAYKVLRHLMTPAALTTSQALSVYGIPRLAARIKELRDMGVIIRTELFKVGPNTRYAAYRLGKGPMVTRFPYGEGA